MRYTWLTSAQSHLPSVDGNAASASSAAATLGRPFPSLSISLKMNSICASLFSGVSEFCEVENLGFVVVEFYESFVEIGFGIEIGNGDGNGIGIGLVMVLMISKGTLPMWLL